MSQICHICNAECQDTEEFCHACGARLVKAEPKSDSTKNGASAARDAAANVSKLLKKPDGLITIVSYILLAVAVLNLIFGVVFLLGGYNAHLSLDMNKKTLKELVDVDGLKKIGVSVSVSASEMYDMEALEDLDISYGGLHAVNIIYGICLIALAGLAVYLFLLIRKHSKQTSLIFMIHALSTLGVVLLYMLLYKITGTQKLDLGGSLPMMSVPDALESLKLNIALPFYVWIHLLIGAGLTAYNFLVFPKIKGDFNQ